MVRASLPVPRSLGIGSHPWQVGPLYSPNLSLPGKKNCADVSSRQFNVLENQRKMKQLPIILQMLVLKNSGSIRTI